MQTSCALQDAGYRMSAATEPNDEYLMDLLSRGQEDALATLVRRYQNDVFRFCLHYVKNVESAKEMAQETFLRIFVARDRFDVDRKFKPWMLCIARNLCLNELKRKKTVQMDTFEEYASASREQSGLLLQSASDGPAEALMGEERRQALLSILDELPEDAFELVMLRYFERLSAREIADVVESTEGAVRTRLHRILKQLRDRYAPLKNEL